MTQHHGNERLAGIDRRGMALVFLIVTVPLFALYLATARTALPYHNDALTNVFAAWNIGTKATPILDEHTELIEYQRLIGWIVKSPRGAVAQYPPGTALLAAPIYTLFSDAPTVELANAYAGSELPSVFVPLPSFWPSAIVAAGTTAAAIGLIAMTTLLLGASPGIAVTTGYVAGLGTSAWTVASDSLWQHGPGMFWVALATWLVARHRWLAAGLAYSMVLLTRPPVVLIGVAVGVWLLSTARWKDAARLLAGATPGAVALLAYNWWLFGGFNVSGGYGSGFTEAATEADVTGYLENIWLAMSHPRYGLFVFTPAVLFLLVVTRRSGRRAPRWAAMTALGGLAVLLLQLKANRASGGGDFLYYRYPLEPLTAAAPLLYVAWRELWAMGLPARLLLATSTVWSMAIHAYADWRMG